ncbi:hypothetical protein [Agrobacterium sp. LAD9]|uniref:hypothetical protein n=1 Tax=Agrobacterium sp. LAD9 TaxID=2055153 RepID=UPI000D1DFBF5|nr:hypothetical protein [Agrobacterium sp. LAD9]
MANTIPTAVSSLGDSFECIVLDSARVSTLSVASTSADTVHELGETTTLGMIYAASSVEVVRADAWDAARSWTLLAGYHPFNLAGGERTLRFRAVDTATAVKILEN